MYLREISEINYKSSTLPVLFEDERTDRMFGIISNNIHSFKFGWQSTNIKPVVKEVSKEIYAIGIDQNFILIDLNIVNIKLKLKLFYFFYNLVVYDTFMIVITELEILIVSLINYNLLTSISLPELYENMETNGKNLKFTCIDGSYVDFNLNEI